MTVEEAEKFVATFWKTPKVEHGQAQVPHFYDEHDLAKLNEAAAILTNLVKPPKA